jgi:hypothetical protein
LCVAVSSGRSVKKYQSTTLGYAYHLAIRLIGITF